MSCKRLLIVDDFPDMAEMLGEVLKYKIPGLSVDVAYDGHSGLTSAMDEHHDAVILDLDLPGMGGADIAAELRLRGGDVPALIALSGNSDAVAHLSKTRLFDHALLKPAEVDELVGLLTEA